MSGNERLISMSIAVAMLFIIGAAIYFGWPFCVFEWELSRAYWFHDGVLNWRGMIR